MKKFVACSLLIAVLSFVSLTALALDQGDFIKPVDKKLKFVFVPKVVHPWYDVVKQGMETAVAEFKERGIEIDVKWDAIPEAVNEAHLNALTDFENKWMEENPADPNWLNSGLMAFIKNPEYKEYFDRKCKASNEFRKKLDKKYYDPYLK